MTLYSLCLDHWPLVADLLTRHPVVGSLRKDGYFFKDARPNSPGMDKSAWHYSGNFWWVRAGSVRDKLAAIPVPLDPWGTEAWPGIAWPLAESGIIGPVHDGPLDMYQPSTWNEHILPAYARWLESRSMPPAVISGTTRLSIILPTSGRESVGRTLESLTPQLEPGDEVILQRDASGDWGMTPRERAMRQAVGDYLLFMDDDDAYEPGALAAVRTALAENPGRPHLFRMRRGAPYHDILWTTPAVREGNVSTQMFVTPNDPSRLGHWGSRYAGDFDFISSTLRHYPGGPVWRGGSDRGVAAGHRGGPLLGRDSRLVRVP